MDNNSMVKSMMAGWASFGIKVDKIADNFDIYISVPEHAEEVDAHGNEMAGQHLASRIQKTLRELTHKKIVVRYKAREGEYWTKQMSKDAMAQSIKESDPFNFLEDI